MSRLCTTHPSAQKLAAFGLGKLAGAAADAIARHIESCDACRHEVENVPADPFLGLIRSVGRPTPTPLDLPPELAAHPRFKVVREFTSHLKERCLGADVVGRLNPGQQVVKIVGEELTALMGGAAGELSFSPRPFVGYVAAGL